MKLTRKVNFDVCTFCNHRCTFCSNSDPRTIKSQTSLEEFLTVMRNVARYVEVSELGLSAKGEVMINKDLIPIVEAAKHELAIPYVYFSTNGALLTREKAEALLEAGIDSIKFSINAVDAPTYRRVHEVDDFDLVIRNFKDLLELKKNRYPDLKITISSVIDMGEEELTGAFQTIFGDDFSLIDKIFRYPITYTPKFASFGSERKVTKKCSIPVQEIYINSDGTLGLCCKDYFDSVNFGSLLENDFMDLYRSEPFEEVRKMHETSEFPDNHLCKNCLLYGDA